MRETQERRSSVSFRYPGEQIRYARLRMGLSQKYLANKVNMSPSGLSKIESGKHMQPRKVVQISNFLGLNPQELTSYDEIEKDSLSDNIETMKKMFPNWKDIIKESIKDLN